MDPLDKLKAAEQLLKNEKYPDAYAAYLSLAEDGQSDAQLDAHIMVGWMKENGKGISHDLRGALEWYRKAANAECPVAQFHVGRVLMRTGELSEALRWFEKAASSEYMPAVYRLAWAYESGTGTLVDKDHAFTLFNQSANGGHLPSQMVLAKKILKGSQGNFKRFWGIYQVLKVYLVTALVAWRDMRDDRIRL
jgi:TPR repeat protein